MGMIAYIFANVRSSDGAPTLMSRIGFKLKMSAR